MRGSHGGKSPRALAAAARRLHAEVVWGTTKTETELGGKSRLTFGGYGADDEDETGLVDVGSVPVSKDVQAAAPSIWLDLYDRERCHLVAVCTAAIKAGVEERRVRLAEAQGGLVAGAIRAILADLGLTAEQARVSEVLPRHLRLLAGGAA